MVGPNSNYCLEFMTCTTEHVPMVVRWLDWAGAIHVACPNNWSCLSYVLYSLGSVKMIETIPICHAPQHVCPSTMFKPFSTHLSHNLELVLNLGPSHFHCLNIHTLAGSGQSLFCQEFDYFLIPRTTTSFSTSLNITFFRNAHALPVWATFDELFLKKPSGEISGEMRNRLSNTHVASLELGCTH